MTPAKSDPTSPTVWSYLQRASSKTEDSTVRYSAESAAEIGERACLGSDLFAMKCYSAWLWTFGSVWGARLATDDASSCQAFSN